MATKGVLIAVTLCLTLTIISALETEDNENLSETTTCSNRSSSCKECTDRKDDCYWCAASKNCLEWKWSKSHALSSDVDCKGHNYYYKQCGLNAAGIIAITVVVVVVVVGLCLCCCVCCCCYYMSRRRKRKYAKLQETHEYTNQAIRSGNNERRAERAAKREEILRKYQRDSSKYDQLA